MSFLWKVSRISDFETEALQPPSPADVPLPRVLSGEVEVKHMGLFPLLPRLLAVNLLRVSFFMVF